MQCILSQYKLIVLLLSSTLVYNMSTVHYRGAVEPQIDTFVTIESSKCMHCYDKAWHQCCHNQRANIFVTIIQHQHISYCYSVFMNWSVKMKWKTIFICYVQNNGTCIGLTICIKFPLRRQCDPFYLQ
jgi:hypothetical protein